MDEDGETMTFVYLEPFEEGPKVVIGGREGFKIRSSVIDVGRSPYESTFLHPVNK